MQRGATTTEQAAGAAFSRLPPALRPLLGGVLALLLAFLGGAPRPVEAAGAPELTALSRPPLPLAEPRSVPAPPPGPSDALPPPPPPRRVLAPLPGTRLLVAGRGPGALTLAELGRRQTDGG